MSDDAIFLRSGGRLVLLQPTQYSTEDVLQAALADHPEVLVGQSTDADEDGGHALILVAREMSIPDTSFSLDHLFLDRDGVPVLVEVKRASDTRIRREVVGQMLDYAANAATSWTVDLLRERIAERAAAAGDWKPPISLLWPGSRSPSSGSRLP